jgi:hypothetical protein
LLLALAMPAHRAGGQEERTASVVGTVRNVNQLPLQGAEVRILGTSLRAVTNDSGGFTLEGVHSGRFKFVARRLGFQEAEVTIRLAEGERKEIRVLLLGIPEMLDSVVVMGEQASGRMADFWRRRTIGVGAFITRAEIERRRPSRPSLLLMALSGVIVSGSDALGQPNIQMGRSGTGSATRNRAQMLAADCQVAYYVDGMQTSRGSFHIDDIPPQDIEAIEVYRGPSEIPAKFRAIDTGCGLIVIWTREPPPRSRPPGGTGIAERVRRVRY